MPRGPRLDAPGILHHVRFRGIERRKIFLNDADRLDIVERLEKCCGDGKAFVYAWCLMNNHVHLAIRTGKRPLSQTMSSLLTGYAVAFNLRHKRSGHFFQNRYKSTVVEDEQYFLGLVRYIHLNPVRAGVVGDIEALATYPWTGHSVLMGKSKALFQDLDEVLGRFGDRVGTARRGLVRFMCDKAAKEEEKVFRGAGGGLIRSMGGSFELEKNRDGPKEAFDERILGSGDFVTSILKHAQEESPLDIASRAQRQGAYEDLVDRVCALLEVERSELMSGGRRRIVTKARQVISYVATRKLGLPGAIVARSMGVSNPAINKAAAKGREAIRVLGWKAEELIDGEVN